MLLRPCVWVMVIESEYRVGLLAHSLNEYNQRQQIHPYPLEVQHELIEFQDVHRIESCCSHRHEMQDRFLRSQPQDAVVQNMWLYVASIALPNQQHMLFHRVEQRSCVYQMLQRFEYSCWMVWWSQRRDSNPRPPDYKSGALPAMLRWPCHAILIPFMKETVQPHKVKRETCLAWPWRTCPEHRL